MGTSNLYLAITVLALGMMGCAEQLPNFSMLSVRGGYGLPITPYNDHCTAVVLGSLAPALLVPPRGYTICTTVCGLLRGMRVTISARNRGKTSACSRQCIRPTALW